jgi:hypothetical protein
MGEPQVLHRCFCGSRDEFSSRKFAIASTAIGSSELLSRVASPSSDEAGSPLEANSFSFALDAGFLSGMVVTRKCVGGQKYARTNEGPGLYGSETCRFPLLSPLFQNAPRTPMLLFTMQNSGQLLQQARDAGIQEVLSKSDVGTDQLISSMRSLLDEPLPRIARQ